MSIVGLFVIALLLIWIVVCIGNVLNLWNV